MNLPRPNLKLSLFFPHTSKLHPTSSAQNILLNSQEQAPNFPAKFASNFKKNRGHKTANNSKVFSNNSKLILGKNLGGEIASESKRNFEEVGEVEDGKFWGRIRRKRVNLSLNSPISLLPKKHKNFLLHSSFLYKGKENEVKEGKENQNFKSKEEILQRLKALNFKGLQKLSEIKVDLKEENRSKNEDGDVRNVKEIEKIEDDGESRKKEDLEWSVNYPTIHNHTSNHPSQKNILLLSKTDKSNKNNLSLSTEDMIFKYKFKKKKKKMRISLQKKTEKKEEKDDFFIGNKGDFTEEGKKSGIEVNYGCLVENEDIHFINVDLMQKMKMFYESKEGVYNAEDNINTETIRIGEDFPY